MNKGEFFIGRDVYIDYPFEQVMFRWDHAKEKVFMRFYGESEKKEPISHERGIFNSAILSGDEISREQYEKGREVNG